MITEEYMTEEEYRNKKLAEEKYRTAWIEASYIVAGWWQERVKEDKSGQEL